MYFPIPILTELYAYFNLIAMHCFISCFKTKYFGWQNIRGQYLGASYFYGHD